MVNILAVEFNTVILVLLQIVFLPGKFSMSAAVPASAAAAPAM
jgi:hypothetical protein